MRLTLAAEKSYFHGSGVKLKRCRRDAYYAATCCCHLSGTSWYCL